MNKPIVWIEGCANGGLAIMPRPSGGDEIGLSIAALTSQRIDVVVSLLTIFEEAELELHDERTVCNANGIDFFSFPIPDRGLPESATAVRRLVGGISAKLSENKRVMIHCRMGIGRSALIAACVLYTQGLTVAQAFDAISTARGVQVPDTEEQRAWVERFTMGYELS